MPETVLLITEVKVFWMPDMNPVIDAAPRYPDFYLFCGRVGYYWGRSVLSICTLRIQKQ